MANFTGTGGDDTITGTVDDDFFDMGQGGNDTVSGGDGNDDFNFGAAFNASDVVDGGNDTFAIDGGADFLELSGDYSVGVVLNANTITNIEEIIFESNFTYALTMNDGNVAAGQNLTIATSLNATAHVDGSAELDGSFNMRGGNQNDSFTGGAGDDAIRGRSGNDIMHGGGGNDYLNGGLGDDLYDGGAGKNRAAFYDGTGSIAHGVTVTLEIQGVAQNTQDGMDTLVNIQDLSGTVFDDVLTGDANANWIWAEGGNDTVAGHGGDDVIYIGPLSAVAPGTDIANGNGGNDTLSFNDNGTLLASITFSLALQGVAQATGVDTLTASKFENVSGSESNDTLTGDGASNRLYGDAGDDTLAGGGGNDQLYGDKAYVGATGVGFGNGGPTGAEDVAVPGNDTLNGGAGNDTIDGGGGSDTADYSDASGGVTVNLLLAGSQQAVGGGAGRDTLFNIENLTGSNHADILTGDGGDNVLTGLDGNDRLTGGIGSDTLAGGNDSDTFVYAAAGESTGLRHDIVNGFDADVDFFQVPGTVKGIDATIASGGLSAETFDADLAAVADASHLLRKHAVLFTPDSGAFAGHTILIIDANATAGYQAGADIVIDLVGAVNLNHLSTADFL
jgi:Ca2+-binding RTX toxin-like protein